MRVYYAILFQRVLFSIFFKFKYIKAYLVNVNNLKEMETKIINPKYGGIVIVLIITRYDKK